MGSDEFGRGILDWIIRGSRISLYVGVFAVGLGTIVGAVFGLISGFFGGKTDYIQSAIVWFRHSLLRVHNMKKSDGHY